jgi:hypothetical protein
MLVVVQADRVMMRLVLVVVVIALIQHKRAQQILAVAVVQITILLVTLRVAQAVRE